MQISDGMSRLGTESAFEVLAQAKKLEAQGKSIIHLQIGEPDFNTPANICEAGMKAIKEGHTHYGPSAGLPEARKVVAEYFTKTRNLAVDPENVVIMPGAKPVMFNLLLATINPGDEVILPNPAYPIYESVVSFLGATPVYLKLHEQNDFRFNADDLKKLVTPKTKMIIINSPHNPTGGILTPEDLEEVYRLAEENDLWILADEIYSRIVYEKGFHSIAAVPGAMDRTVFLDGMSKTYSMTGWRLGYGVMPKPLAEHMTRLAINNYSCTATFSQFGLMEALTGPQIEVEKMVAEFQHRRDVFVDGLNKIDGISCLRPEGAFYVFPNISATGMKSKPLADLLLHEAGVAGLSGTAFGTFGEGYLRFSYANSVENIQEGLRRIENTLAGVAG